MNRWVLLFLPSTLLFADETVIPEECCYEDSCFSLEEARRDRISARHLEGTGVGFTRGYTSLDLFLSHCFCDNLYPFLDLSGHYFNNQKWAANGGLGLRYLMDNCPSIFGFNVFYDYYKPRRHQYHQIGGGIEWLTPCWSVNINGYFPVSQRKFLREEGFDDFKGHRAIFEKKQEFSFIGTDLEIGRTIFQNSCFDLQGIVGGYYFSGKEDKQAGGALVRIEANLSSYFTVNGQGSWDNHFKWRGSGELQINLPFGPCNRVQSRCFSCCDSTLLERKLSKKVRRFEIIPTSTNTKKSSALNPVTGEPLNFIFVNNQLGSSDGSIENPYRTLTDAAMNSSAGDVLYVFTGDGTSRGMDQGVILKNNQRLLGSGVDHSFTTRFGQLSVPQLTAERPLLESILPFVVEMGNDGEVSGFRVNHIFSGIHANSVSNALVTRNDFVTRTTGFEADNCAGTIIVKDNIFHDNPPSLSSGVTLFAGGSSSFSAIVQNNTFDVSNLGVVMIGETTGILNFDIHANTFLSNASAIFVAQTGLADSFDIAGTIRNNSILSSPIEGMLVVLEGNAKGDFVVNDNLIQGLDTNVAPINFNNSSTSTMNLSASRNQLFGTAGEFRIANSGMGITNLKLVENRAVRISLDPGYLLEQTAGTFNLKQLSNNLGTFSQMGTITVTD